MTPTVRLLARCGVAASLTVGLASCGERSSTTLRAGPAVAAMTRADAVLIPFARYDDGAWTAPDDIADQSSAWFADHAASLDAWLVRRPARSGDPTGDPDGARAETTLVEVHAHCQRVWGLRSDQPAEPPVPGDPHHATGVAVSGDAMLEPVSEPDLGAADRSAWLEFLEPLFDAAEDRLARERDGLPGYEPRRIGRGLARAPLAFSRMQAIAAREGRALFLFEIRRAYARPTGHPIADCDELTIMTGWLARAADGTPSLLRSDTAFGDCSGKGTPTLQAMGVIDVGDRQFAAVVEHDYELETFVIYSLDRESVSPVLRVKAGGC